MAPPVVAVVVVHRPGPEFAETLRSLAAQDYPALQCLVLVAGASAVGSDPADSTGSTPGASSAGDIAEDMVSTELPTAVVRRVATNPGFASVANMVIDLVDGESGLFLFVHDDAALAPDAVSRLVEEMYRTNAGVVSPKIVTWADPGVIESVGDDVDRLGARDPVAEAGERDQEQHDSVRDAFAVSTACMLVRGDLFRAVGGFEPSLQVCGADLDFCWRVHLAGARVVVAPSAVVRHRSETTTRLRRADPLRLEDTEETERVATTLALSPTSSLPLVVAALVGSAAVRSLMAVVAGSPRRAWTPWRALVAAVRGSGRIRARRHRAREVRNVEASEVRSLQILGSARMRRWWRLRSSALPTEDRETDIAGREVVTTRRWSVVTWAVLVGLTVLGGRSILLHGSEAVGQFVPFAGSAGDHWTSFTANWWPTGLGDASFAPTGMGLVAVLGVLTFGNMGLAHTLAIVALPVAGYAGAWALAGVFGQRRARIVGTVAYAAVPLPYAAMSAGRWGALVTYAALPWFVHHARHLVGHRTESQSTPAGGAPAPVGSRDGRRRWAMLSLTTAAAVAFEPGFIVVVAVTAVVLAFGTLIADGGGPAARWLAVGAATTVIAVALNLPWSTNFLDGNFWNQLTGAAVTGGRESGLVSLARFDVGRVPFGGAFLLVYVVVVAAVLLVRGPRGPWAARGSLLGGFALFLALLDDKALLPARLPEPAVVLVPVALGISLACGALGASLAIDVRRARFGWRQPLGAAASLAFVVAGGPPGRGAGGGGG
jgi:GT2 family glycosyltransferase